jgi:RNA polymerase sigma-70 factor (ECF subfamily)
VHREWVLDALQEYELRLLRYALRLLGDEGAARDVVQHAMLRLCDESPHNHPDGPARWLYTVVRNRALDALRLQGRERSLEEDSGSEDLLWTRDFDPANVIERQELLAVLRRLLDELSTPQQEAIVLWSEGFSYGEMAQITSRTEGSLRVTVHRVLERLREHPLVTSLSDDTASSRPAV